MMIGPAINLLSAPRLEGIKWWRKGFLYNADFASRQAAALLYPWGISTDPAQVVISRDDWLYLGDKHDRTLTSDRHAQTPLDVARSRKIGDALAAWEAYMVSQGVKVFKLMIGPNKTTIYAEHTPEWARPVSPSATDTLLQETGGRFHLDLRPALLEAKSREKQDLYYKTDTHWNRLGSSIAFRSFAQQVSRIAPEIAWPSEEAYAVVRTDPRPGGDLANFLRLSARFTDPEPIVGVFQQNLKTSHFNFDSGQPVAHDGNPDVASPDTPLLVKSEHALNRKKVLWLRDSFGTTMAPYMAATFEQTLQLHWVHGFKQGGRLLQLIDAWKPDYVFVTVVERAAQNDVFSAYPPPVPVAADTQYHALQAGIPLEFNQLTADRIRNRYQVSGGDPFIDFSLPAPVMASDVNLLRLELSCDDGSPTAPVQIFWLADGQPYFDEKHSAKLSLHTGGQLIDLHALAHWRGSGAVRRLRVDVDAGPACASFTLGAPGLGTDRRLSRRVEP